MAVELCKTTAKRLTNLPVPVTICFEAGLAPENPKLWWNRVGDDKLTPLVPTRITNSQIELVIPEKMKYCGKGRYCISVYDGCHYCDELCVILDDRCFITESTVGDPVVRKENNKNGKL